MIIFNDNSYELNNWTKNIELTCSSVYKIDRIK
jgi:hypothetical protein